MTRKGYGGITLNNEILYQLNYIKTTRNQKTIPEAIRFLLCEYADKKGTTPLEFKEKALAFFGIVTEEKTLKPSATSNNTMPCKYSSTRQIDINSAIINSHFEVMDKILVKNPKNKIDYPETCAVTTLGH